MLPGATRCARADVDAAEEAAPPVVAAAPAANASAAPAAPDAPSLAPPTPPSAGAAAARSPSSEPRTPASAALLSAGLSVCDDVASLLAGWPRKDKRSNEKAFTLAQDAVKRLRDELWKKHGAELFSDATLLDLDAPTRDVAGEALACAAHSAHKAELRCRKTHAVERAYWAREARFYAAWALRTSPGNAHALFALAQLAREKEGAQHGCYTAAECLLVHCEATGHERWAKAATAVLKAVRADLAAALERLVKLKVPHLEAALNSPAAKLLRGLSPEKAEAMAARRGLPVADATAHLLFHLTPITPAEVKWKGVTHELCRVLAKSPPAFLTQPEAAHKREHASGAATGPVRDCFFVGWNMQSSASYHNVSAGLPAKVASLAAMHAELEFQLAALVECPGAAVANEPHPSLGALITAALPRWSYAEASTGAEATGFAYNTGALTLLAPPRAFPDAPPPGDEGAVFCRPPVLAVFAAAESGASAALCCEPLGLLAVCAVHLKSVKGDKPERTQAELRRLAADVLPWIEAQLDAAAKLHPAAAARGRTLLFCCDFNLGMGGSAATAVARHTHAGDAWAGLLNAGLVSLTRPGATTNFGPPVTEHDHEYDAALVRCEGGARASLRHANAWMYPAMEAECHDVARVLALLAAREATPDMPRTSVVDECAEHLKAELQRRVKLRWGDHKPVIVHLQLQASV